MNIHSQISALWAFSFQTSGAPESNHKRLPLITKDSVLSGTNFLANPLENWRRSPSMPCVLLFCIHTPRKLTNWVGTLARNHAFRYTADYLPDL